MKNFVRELCQLYFDNEGNADDKTFTQDDLNKILATEKRKFQESQQKLTQELEALKNKANLTQEERADLEKKLQASRTEFESEKDTLTRQMKEANEKFSKEMDLIKSQSSQYKNLFENHYRETELMRAIVSADPYNANQIVDMLRPNSSIVDVLDAEGKPTGKYSVKIKWNSEGKEVALAPEEVVKRMKEDVKSYGNLFKNNLKEGFGETKGDGTKIGMADLKNLSFEQYQKHRASILGESS